ncbi:MAG TPA: hypothetical protein VFQ23_16195 [Anaerolineales bacterium]|nr:hypothetical protein [Anaerolineales bacterium]
MNEPTSVPDWLSSGVTALDSFLKSHPDAEQQVREILDKRLVRMDANTWNSVFMNLDNYWGKECTDVLYNVTNIAQPDLEKRFQEIGQSATVEVINFLRKIISLYGPEFDAAFLALSQLPHNWKTFYRDVFYDHVNKRTHLRVRFAKYNGEEPFLEGSADSMLELTILMMQTIGFLPSGDLVGTEMAGQFVQEANKLITFLQPPPLEESVNQPESQPDVQGEKPKSKKNE